MKIIADDSPLGEVIEKAFAPLSERTGIIVFVEHAVKNGLRQDLHGLDDTLVHAPSGIPIVMLAWQSQLMIADDPRLHAALGYTNVVLRQLPEGVVDIMAALDEAGEKKRMPDPLAIALLTAEDTKRDIGILQHDLHSAETNGGERMVQWETRARKVFGEKSQAELIELVKQPRKEEGVDQFAGQTFPDVCVDVEGTLFTDEGIFRQDVLGFAELLAKPDGRPITIWTGGDLEAVRKMVRKAGIPHKLVSKHMLRGASVGIIVDDLPSEAFSREYGIGFESYRQI